MTATKVFSNVKKTKSNQIRIIKNIELSKIINEIQADYPLFSESDIIKMLISDGYKMRINLKFSNKNNSISNFLKKREKNGNTISNLTEKQQNKLLIDNDLM